MNKKVIKYFSFLIVALFSCVLFSNINAATLSKGNPVQLGYDVATPENGTTINKNTGIVIYYPAKIGGKQAYCLDYLAALPEDGANLTIARKLTDIEKGVLLNGYPYNLQGVSGDIAMSATQVALWSVTSGARLSSLDRIKQQDQYIRQDAKKTTDTEWADIKATANKILAAAKKFDKTKYVNSWDISIKVDTSKVKSVAKGGYLLVGPYKATHALKGTKEKASMNISTNDKGKVLVVSSNGTALNTVAYGQEFYLKLNYNTYTNKNISFTLKIPGIQTYMFAAYEQKGTERQKFGMAVVDTNTAEKTVKYTWSLKGSITIIKQDDHKNLPVEGAKFGVYDKNKKIIKEVKTDKTGTVTVTGLEYGTYYIKEIEAPSDYLITQSDFIEIKVESSNESKTVKNHLIRGRVTLQKVVEYTGFFKREENVGEGDAEFTIYNAITKEKVATMKTDKNGMATSEYLEKGNYYLRETAVNTSYMKKNNDILMNFSITKDNDMKTINLGKATNPGLDGSFEVFKYILENEKKVPLKGVKFQLYILKDSSKGTVDSNLQKVCELTTNAAGKANAANLKNGKYAYKEVSVPTGVKIDSKIKTFEITSKNRSVKVEVKNDYSKGVLNIEKVEKGTGKPLEGIVFTVFASNKKDVVTTLKTDKNGKASTTLKYGTYYVKETSGPANVVLSSKNSKIVLKEDPNNSNKEVTVLYKVENETIDLGIKILKLEEPVDYDFIIQQVSETLIDKDGKILSTKPKKVSLSGHKKPDPEPLKGVKFGLYTDEECKHKVAEATTNSSGYAIFDHLEEKTYYYKELSTLEGYISTGNEKPTAVTLNYKTNPVYTTTITNRPILGTIKIVKVDEEGKALEGAQFQVEDKNGEIVDVITTDKDGIALSCKLKKGTYTLRETEVPSGYKLLQNSFKVSINKDKEVVEKKITNYYDKGKVIINKVDSETKEPITDAVFEVYRIEDNGKEKLVDTISKFSNKGVGTSKELKNGKYYVIEKVAPKGAILDKTKHEFEITDKEKEINLTIENKFKKAQIKLIKRDDGGNIVAGAKFDILDSNKNVLESLTVDENGEAISKKYRVGTYYVRETYTPDLYIPLSKDITVELTDDGQIAEISKEIINERIKGGIKITKKDDAGTPIAGVKFDIYKEGGLIPTTTIVTDEQGIAITNQLYKGKYYFVEKEVPDNIYITTDKVAFEVEEKGQMVTKEVVNNRVTGGLKILKTNSENGTAIQGVVFEILDSDKNVIGSISTDLDGVATTDNLVDKDGKKIILYVGTYYYREVSAPTRFHFDTTEHEFIVAKGKEVADVKIENTPFKLPQTGGFISTDGIIIIIVSVVSILGYVIINIIVNKKRFS